MARKIKLERSLFISLSSHSVRICYFAVVNSTALPVSCMFTLKSRVGRRRGRRCFPAKVLYLKAVLYVRVAAVASSGRESYGAHISDRQKMRYPTSGRRERKHVAGHQRAWHQRGTCF